MLSYRVAVLYDFADVAATKLQKIRTYKASANYDAAVYNNIDIIRAHGM